MQTRSLPDLHPLLQARLLIVLEDGSRSFMLCNITLDCPQQEPNAGKDADIRNKPELLAATHALQYIQHQLLPTNTSQHRPLLSLRTMSKALERL
jgi:hypothetical protein